MPDFKGVENLNLILAFIVPGLVITAIRNRFIIGRLLSTSEVLITYMTLSVIYFGLIAPVLQPILSIAGLLPKASTWLALTIVSPALLGLLLGAAAQLELGRKLAHRAGLSPVHYIPTANVLPRDKYSDALAALRPAFVFLVVVFRGVLGTCREVDEWPTTKCLHKALLVTSPSIKAINHVLPEA